MAPLPPPDHTTKAATPGTKTSNAKTSVSSDDAISVSHSLTITVGRGCKKPQGKNVTLSSQQSVAHALADALRRDWTGDDPWVSLSTFSGAYRSGGNFIAATGRGIDLDFYDSEGSHALVPADVSETLEGLVLAGYLGGHVYHGTPHGIRLFELYNRAIVTIDEFKAVAAVRTSEIMETLKTHKLAATLNKINGKSRKVDGYHLDSASADAARFFWPANATVGGVKRRADIHVL